MRRRPLMMPGTPMPGTPGKVERPHEWPAPPSSLCRNLANVQQVAVVGERIVIHAPHIHMTRDEALVHAAWLVTLAQRPEDEGRFAAILEVVRKL